MTLTQLRYLVAIADAELNITLAASRVHATQPGLSKQLKQLEDELGFLLFVRKGRSLESVTPAGTEVISRARAVLAEANNIRTYAANQRRESQGQLILTTTHTQARFVLPPAVAAIKQAYPQVSVHLQQAAEADALDRLNQGDADIAIISTAGGEPGDGIAVPLFRWRRLVVVPKGHPLDRAGRAPDLAALARQPLISYESSTRPNSSLQRAFAANGLVPDLALTALDADLIKTYVRTGLGVGLLAEMAVSSLDEDLKAWPAPAPIAECIAWAVLPRDRVLRDYALELVHVLAPQIDPRDLRRVLDGNQVAAWPLPPTWESLTQTITV
ncbi:LysR family transcriptional regulator [Stenotrophomonas maltophilia]|jgi:LysR family cys regulon transcriptional activator|uniref:CysB family transcriptional regulator n=2 Tax=Gammaproteobacteria TaxID=1236 RepID=A0AAP7GTK5_STEMA|nr:MULTISPECIES: LysR family transcriptional regulator [Stenotrophomonas]KOQ70379.1 CysB family transcriptional regulator [Stenotrophomonas maltophilia]MBA0220882.1 LysR family transcriptional regulator [Stenotrophomonas maltophilia]MBE5271192.1 LysR family transcriptional regulator [Stenotrophomonas sp. B2]MBH1835952.1 LysR family transcriptional regulator [Stenotrophomonas maltophilia]MBN4938507.1 LysR family transcriptional regulator [Stenotrophomonas maltophilia]